MNKLTTSLILTAAILLAGCEATKEQFDFSKKAPDEFAVVTRAPLEMPSSYTLPKPRPGQARPQELSTDNLARQSILGAESVQQAASGQQVMSEGEAVLLRRTGAGKADPNIRGTIDRETAEMAKDSLPGIDKLRSMVGQKVEAPAKVVDPVAEIERLKQNKAAGKPATAGKTPTIEN